MKQSARRSFLSRIFAAGSAAAAAAPAAAQPAPVVATGPAGLSGLHLARQGRRKRISSYNREGRNADRIQIPPGQTATLAEIAGAGCVRHIWVTIADDEPDYLRRIVLRAWWDGEREPSIECPVGDFFGVGHARSAHYWSLPLNMVSGGDALQNNRAAMNCFFPMPFAKGARFTVENQGERQVGAFYYYIDYEQYDQPAPGALPFHAQWRRENPTRARVDLAQPGMGFKQTNDLPNPDGKGNYVLLEAEGRGHYVGCNISVDHINPIKGVGWFGEGDDMIYIDGEAAPSLIGTGTEDYFCAAWGYPSGAYAMPYHGISLAGPTEGPESYSGKWTMYRYHIEDPVMFAKSIKVTIEAGHANVHANDYSSVAYWYQTEPHRKFPALLPVAQRLPRRPVDSLKEYWKTR